MHNRVISDVDNALSVSHALYVASMLACNVKLTLVNVVAHDRDGVVDLGVNTSGFRVGEVGSIALRIGAGVARRDVRIVTAVVVSRHDVCRCV